MRAAFKFITHSGDDYLFAYKLPSFFAKYIAKGVNAKLLDMSFQMMDGVLRMRSKIYQLSVGIPHTCPY